MPGVDMPLIAIDIAATMRPPPAKAAVAAIIVDFIIVDYARSYARYAMLCCLARSARLFMLPRQHAAVYARCALLICRG